MKMTPEHFESILRALDQTEGILCGVLAYCVVMFVWSFFPSFYRSRR